MVRGLASTATGVAPAPTFNPAHVLQPDDRNSPGRTAPDKNISGENNIRFLLPYSASYISEQPLRGGEIGTNNHL